MIAHPQVMALLLGSGLELAAVLVAASVARQVLAGFDLADGSRRQVELEKRTYLATLVLSWGMVVELFSLLLLVFTLDGLAVHFPGAMCAVGTLNAGSSGWAYLATKLVGVLGAGVWLTMDRLDAAAPDLPLVRPKAVLTLLLLPVAGLETWLGWRFFSTMDPRVAASCCSQLFEPGASTSVQGLALGSPALVGAVLLAGTASTLLAAGAAYRTLRTLLVWLAAASAQATALASLVAIVVVVAPYVYESPHHHCPFCLLQSGHGSVGIPIYALWLYLWVGSAALGVVSWWSDRASLTRLWPDWCRARLFRLVLAEVALLLVFAGLVARSRLTLPLT